MIVKTKKVFYCEFCKKKSLATHSMLKHEKHCTLNPKRECRLCKNYSLKPGECPICEFSFARLQGKKLPDLKEEMRKFWENENERQIKLTEQSTYY